MKGVKTNTGVRRKSYTLDIQAKTYIPNGMNFVRGRFILLPKGLEIVCTGETEDCFGIRSISILKIEN